MGALHTPLTWPKGVPTRPEMDQLAGGTRPAEFALDSAALAAAIQRLGRQARAFQFSRHPIFGDLTEWEWMRWGYLHAHHHFPPVRSLDEANEPVLTSLLVSFLQQIRRFSYDFKAP
jgi:hypothetical protein